MIQPLRGAWVVVTRPVAEARELAGAIKRHGGEPIIAPAIAIERMPGRQSLRAALLEARHSDAVIFVSRYAVRYARELAPELFVDRTRLWAVGPGTAEEAGGLQLVEGPRANSEALLEEQRLGPDSVHTVSIVQAPNGRGLLQRKMRERGQKVHSIDVYRRAVTEPAEFALEQWTEHSHDSFLTVTSIAILEAIHAALPAKLAAAVRERPLIAASERIAKRARELGFQDVVASQSARSSELIDAIANIHKPKLAPGDAFADHH